MASTLLPRLLEEIRNSPAATPPPGVIPNYDSPSNDNRQAFGVIGVSVVVAVSAGLLRLYSKLFCMDECRFRLEDYLGFASFPFFFAGTWALCKIPQQAGFFIHQWDLRMNGLEWFLHYYILSTLLYCVTLLLAKAAILLEFSHVLVARPHRNAFFWMCYGMIAANTSLYIATIFAIIFACKPLERLTQPYLPGTCIDFNLFNVVIASFHLVFDLLMLLLPQIVIWKIRLTKRRQKIGLSIIFSVAGLACVWAGGRVSAAVDLTRSQDRSYAYTHYVMWGLAEVATAVLVFSAPAFPAVFRELRRLYRFVRSKAKTTSSPENLASIGGSLKLQRTADSETLPSRGYMRFDIDSSGSLTQLDPVKIESGRKFEGENHGKHLRGILVSTEIAISSHEDSTSKGRQVVVESTRPPW